MAHYRLLFVGTLDNLQRIYNQCDDSSSESKAELAFGYDYIVEEEIQFTKKDKELYKRILDCKWHDCLDVRDPDNYGDFAWVNMPEEMKEVKSNIDYQQVVLNAIRELPDDMVFFFADAHL